MKLSGHVRRPRTHDWVDRRSLALDQAIAKKIRNQPELLQKAQTTLQKWIEQKPVVPPVFFEWQDILTQWPQERILELLTRFDEEARRLRQSSPFCGILSPEERMAIFNEYESR